MSRDLRIAFFPDSYLEVNGAAMTCRRLVDHARDNGWELLCIHAAPESGETFDGSVTNFSFKRSLLSFSLDHGLSYDPLFMRHYRRAQARLLEFKPDVIHITGLNDVSILGAVLAWQHKIPMVGSWHTNIHEFAATRLRKMFSFLPAGIREGIANLAERKIMDGSGFYYKMPKVILAPNQELVDDLARRTGRISRLMARGIDSEFFDPAKRTVSDDVVRIGFVGRLRAEKNVRLLADIERRLIENGLTGFEFLIVGEGNERSYLESSMRHVRFTGYLEGEPLAEAYANMDVFVFPSETDAFGNVAQEAMASGAPPIVSDKGGPKYAVDHGRTGFVASNLDEFAEYATRLIQDGELRTAMARAGREFALTRTWESIFDGVYHAYETALELARAQDGRSAAKNAVSAG